MKILEIDNIRKLEIETILEKDRRRIKLSELEDGLIEAKRLICGDRELRFIPEFSPYIKTGIKSLVANGYSTLQERDLYLKHIKIKIAIENQTKIKEEELKKIKDRLDSKTYCYIDQERLKKLTLSMKYYELFKIIKENQNEFYSLGLIDRLKSRFNIGETINSEITNLFKDDNGKFLSKKDLEYKKDIIFENSRDNFPFKCNSEFDFKKQNDANLKQFEKVLKENDIYNNNDVFQVTDENRDVYINHMLKFKQKEIDKIEQIQKDILILNNQLLSLNQTSGLSKKLEEKIGFEVELAFMATRASRCVDVDKTNYTFRSTLDKIYNKNKMFKVNKISGEIKQEEEQEKIKQKKKKKKNKFS